jgi:hypothetical protein
MINPSPGQSLHLHIQWERAPPCKTFSQFNSLAAKHIPEKDEMLVPAGISEKNAREVMS